MPRNPVLDVIGQPKRRNPVLDVLGPKPAPEPGMLEGIGDTLTESLGGASSTILENARTGRFREDASRDEGFFDRAGSLLESGGASIDRGIYTAISALTGSERARERARILAEGGAEVAGRTTWEDVKANPSLGGLGRYIVDTGIESIPGMAAAATGPGIGILGLSQSGSIAEQRAQNDGRREAGAADVFAAAPAGFGSALLERAGIESIFRPAAGTALRRIAGAAAGEGLTEGVQGSIEYGGSTIGTERGFDIAEMGDQALAGAVAGAGMGGGIRGGLEVGEAGLRATGLRQRAQAAAESTVTQEDIDSPLDTGDIVEGRATVIDAELGREADSALGAAGLPRTGERVTVTMPDGSSRSGTMRDTFTDESGDGVEIELDGGRVLREYADTLADAGVEISLEDMAREADAIDAGLAEVARQPIDQPAGPGGVVPSSEPAQPAGQAAPPAEGPRTPVSDGGAVIRSIFGDKARITSTRRGKDHPLTKANPRSWHSRSNAAVDMAPIPGMTFEQAKAAIEAQGYTLIEALNEVGSGRSKHATGDHWHFVIGSGGAAASASDSPNPTDVATDDNRTGSEFTRPDLPEIEPSDAPQLAMPERRREAVQDDMFGGPSRSESEIAARDSIDALLEEVRSEDPDADLSTAWQELQEARAGIEADGGRHSISSYLDMRSDVPFALRAAADANPKIIDALGERLFVGGRMPAKPEAAAGTTLPAVATGRDVEGEYVEHATVRVGNSTFPFTDFADASQAYRRAIDTLGLGGSQTPPGEILDSKGKVTAHLAYNGRVFPGDSRSDEWKRGPLYDPIPPREDGLKRVTATRVEQTESGKGLAVIGASESELAAIARDVPKAKAVKRKDGALVYSAKYADEIRQAIDGATGDPRYQRPAVTAEEAAKTSPVLKEPDNDASRFAILRAAYEGRGGALFPGARRWALNNSYAAERGKKGNLVLTRQGEEEMNRAGLASGAPLRQDLAPRSSATPKQDALKAKLDSKRGGARLRDWSGVIVPDASEQGQRGDYDGGPTKEAFLKDGKDYLTAVSKLLAAEGFSPGVDRKGKPKKAVHVNQGGTAVAGDVYLEMYPPEGAGATGVQVQFGQSALNGPNGGASLIARTIHPTWRELGSNNWWPVDLTAAELTERLLKLANYETAAPAREGEALPTGTVPKPSDGTAKTVPLGSASTGPIEQTPQTSREAQAVMASQAAEVARRNASREQRSRFAGNKLFTEDKVEAARARLREKMNRLNSGVDPETLVDGMTIAGAYIEAGIRNFAEFAKAMTDDFGEKITPFLLSFWEGARNYPGLDTTGMTPPDASRAMHDMLQAGIEPREPSSDTDVDAATTAAADRPPTPLVPAAAGLSQEQVTTPGISATESDDERATPDRRTEGDDRASDARSGADRAPEGESDRETGADPDRPGRAGAQRTRGDAGEGRGGNRGRADAAGPDGPEAEGGARGDGDRARPGDRVPTGKPERGSGLNLVAAPGSLRREGGWKATAERNLDIVELVGRIEAENRPATPEEQAQLVKFTGWGASEIRNNLFRSVTRDKDGTRRIVPHSYGEWVELSKRAAELLTGDALETALQSTQYAHYTSEKVIRSIWAAVERLGFRGGSVLEPGMGIGLFPIAAPARLMEASRYTGIELDSFSARVARLLLPQENVLAADFIEQTLPDGFFDLAIGNPPFADIKVQADPAYRRYRFSLHDYFFAKTIDKVRPGGLLVFVTSRYTMDKQDAKARDYIAERADLLGAIRLPQTAFKENAGTEVVTDVLFLQRRAPGTEGDYAAGIAGGQPWTSLDEVEVGSERMLINEYFVRHPEMVLGRHALTGSMYRTNEYTVEPLEGDIETAFAEATGRLPEGAMKDAPQASGEALVARSALRDIAPGAIKEGGVYLSDKGEVLIREHGVGVPVAEAVPGLAAGDVAWLKDYAGLRDAVKQAQRDQLEDGPWDKSLAALNKAYDRFVKKHGQISAFTTYERTTENESGEKVTTTYRRFKNAKRLAIDVESTLVEALEKIGEDGKVSKAPFLLDRTLNKPVRRQVETAADALAVTLDEIGKFDAGHAASLLGVGRDELLNQLGDEVFQTPSGDWLLADEYLSGDVRAKLEEARLASSADARFERNVSALERVLPKPLAHADITVKLGVGWIEPEVVAQFAGEIMGEDIDGIAYEPATGAWTVPNARKTRSRSATAEWGTADRTALELLDALLNNRSIKVTRTERTESGTKTWTDQEATALANERAGKIRDAFKAWLWTDAQRTARLVEKYNRNFNNLAPRRFDGRHLTFPGLSSRYSLYDHQRRAIWRIIATGNTYLNHAVGAGKTLEMIVAGMEQRRLGLIKKPMYAVPNHMLNQFAREFLDAYPAANIMVADEQAFHTDNRRRFMAQAALNDPDAIIVSHSSFGKIAPSAEARDRVLRRFIAELETIQDELEGQENRVARSKIEKQIEKLKQRFLGKAGNEGKDRALTFEEMGVDFLFVDEAHEFRKLDFATNRAAVKGIDPNGSQRALDLYIKLLGLHSARPGRAGVLASGTPVTNTMAEIYTVMRFLDPDGLERDGLAAFDAWAAMFGEVAAGFEQNAAGGYEMVERFSKFVNVPELMARVRRFMDVLTSEQLGSLVKRPDVKGRVPENVVVSASDDLKTYMKVDLQTRIKKSREWKPSKDQPGNPDPIINIITDGRLSALDMRFVDRGAQNDPGSKLNKMIDKIIEKHREFADTTFTDPATGKPLPKKGATQIVFSPVGFGDQIAANRGFDARAWMNKRLAEAGVPASAVAWMNDQNTHAKKESTFKALRAGDKRILAGSPKNMGTGVNVQTRLKVLHFLAPPWFPADVEQPHGRIIRQGNLNEEVEIYWYATKGTYDSTGWNMVSRKQRFIDQAMRGDASVRTIEDISEANQYEMASALAAGDERVIQLAGLGNDIERLERLASAHEEEQQRIQGEMRAAQRRIERRKSARTNLEAALKVKGGYEPFALTVGGARYDKPGEAGKALIEEIGREFDAYSGTEEKRVEVGNYLGRMPVVVAIDERENLDGKLVKLWSLIVKVGPLELELLEDRKGYDGLDPTGTAQRIQHGVGRLSSELTMLEQEEADDRLKLRMAEKRLGAPYEYAGDLAEKIAERARLQKELADETAAAEAQAKAPKDSRIDAAPELPTVSVRTADWGKLPTSGRGRLMVLRGRVNRWYQELVESGATVTTRDGRVVEFSDAGRNKTLRAGEDLLALARAIPKIIERGALIGSEPGDRRGLVAVHRYAANVRDESGSTKALLVMVREAPDGTFHYSLNRYVGGTASDGPALKLEPAGLARGAELKALEGAAEDELNLVALEQDDNSGSSATPASIEAVRAELATALEKMGLAEKTRLRVVEGLVASSGFQGRFLPFSRTIMVALDAENEHSFVLHHESLHALREMGVFSKSDWKLLVDRALREPALWTSVKRRYPELTRDGQEEEAVADLFAMYQRGDFSPQGTIAKLLVRLAKILGAIRNALRGQGFTTSRTFFEVFEEAADGRAAARATDAGPEINTPAADARDSRPDVDNMVDLAGSDPTWRGKTAEAYERFRTAMQDRYLPLLRVQRAIERQTGKALPPELNPYLGEELMSGRIGTRLERLTEDHVEPLFDAMHAEGVSIDELESYLYARHAPERNARIAEINPDFEEGSGSGMTDLEAAAVMNRIDRAGKAAAMERLAKRVDAMRDLALDYRVETGLMSQEDADTWRETYEHYVPLRGFAETGMGDPAVADRINRSGGGINVRGKESKRAFGRRSQADSILAYTILQAEEAIVRGETNRVAQRFVDLARSAPDPEFWSVQKVTERRHVNPETGLVETYLTHNLLAEDKDWTVSAKFDGKERRVTLNRGNPAARRLADSMRNLTQHQLDWVTLHLGKLNRFLSAVNTSWNPEFVITNAFRDLQTAGINMLGIDVEGLAGKALKLYPGALKGSTKGAFGKADPEWSRWYDEFTGEGGRVSFNRVEDIGLIKKRIESGFRLAAAKAGQGDARLQIKRGLLAVRDLVENANSGVENAVRLAAYRAARESGVSKPQAASIAKNLTVNFNRRGVFGPAMNALYLFYNASIQGSVRMLQATRSPKVRAMLAGVVAAGLAAELLNAMLSGDDDDGESFYDKIPPYEKSRNIIIMLPNSSEYIKLPSPWGYNVFWELGRSIGEVGRRGGQRWTETGANWLTTVADAFNPVGGTDSILNLLSPTVTDPVVDLELNRDFTGRPIMPEENQYGPEEPDAQRYWNSVAPHWKAVTDFLTQATGGDDVVPGAIDVSPETLEHLAGVVLGAAGSTLDRVISIPAKAASGDLQVNDVPIARKVLGEAPAWHDKAVFYDRLGEVEQTVDDAKDYIEAERMDAAARFADDHERVLMLEADAKAARKEMRAIRKAKRANDAAREKGQIDRAAFDAERKAIEEAERIVIDRFNSAWNATVYSSE